MTTSATAPRRPRRRTWLAIGSVIAVATLAWGVLQIVVAWAYASDTTSETISQPVHTIDARGSGRIVITGADTDHVELKTKVRRGLVATDHSADVVDGVLRLRGDCPGFLSNYCSVDWTLTVPHDVGVVVRDDHGRVTVSDVSGPVDLASDDGRVEAIRVPGATTLRSDHGDVVVAGSGATTVDAATDHGDIRLDLAAVPTAVTARTDHGDVTVVVPAGGESYAVDADTDHGSRDVGVKVDPAAPRTVSAHSSHGDVSLTYRTG